MNNTVDFLEMENHDISESNYALKIALQTMKERCQQLENRLKAVEKENSALRSESNEKHISASLTDNKSVDQSTVTLLQEKVDDLIRQKSQLTHHFVMVAAENRQLWNRLTWLTQANKSLGDKDQTLEEISLKLRNTVRLDKSELQQQYTEIPELHSSINIHSIGFSYPEDVDKNSSDHLKYYELRLSELKEALFIQNEKLKKVLTFVEKLRSGKSCKNCLKNTSKKTCQIGTQITISDFNMTDNYSQTSLEIDDDSSTSDSADSVDFICPLCGIYFGRESPFQDYNEHCLSHFSAECKKKESTDT